MRTIRPSPGLMAAAACLWLLVGWEATAAQHQSPGPGSRPASRPSFILILADDLGYGDLGCYGARGIPTPNLDRMAAEGMRFTNFYAQTVCGPSRAALMTGSYPLRVGTRRNRVEHHPRMHAREITVAEILKGRGYTTAAFGKWDLAGHSQTKYEPDLLPTHQGFDRFFGTPTSNDTTVSLLRNETVVERSADMSTLTRRYTEEAIAFIKEAAHRPFFVYLAHTMPHTELAVSDRFIGRSSRGLYGDVVAEIDWSVGRILDVLKELDLERSTYVLFMSDNGPWQIKGKHGGSATPLRGAKTSAWEGGLRVPCIMRASGRIPGGRVCDEIASTLDILPTLASIAGASAPGDRIIDGDDIRGLIHGNVERIVPARVFYYYQRTRLRAIRVGRWKLHLPHPADKVWGNHIAAEDNIDIDAPLLFDLESDVGERNNVAFDNPDVVARLLHAAGKARDDIGDYDRIGAGARFFDPDPRRPDLDLATLPEPALFRPPAHLRPAAGSTGTYSPGGSYSSGP